MLSDKNFRKRVVEKIQDPVVKAFWVNEFSSYNDKFASEAVAPIQNKVGQFLSSSLIRNIVGQVRSSIDLRDIMDNGKILIMNLSKGRIGEDNSALLGSMMITKLQLAAMSRVDTPEEERRDFFLYVDEFQNFATDSFANILSEARKYHLSLILAHQYIDQLTDSVRAAVFGNVGTLITFRVGATDAEFLAKEFLPLFTEEDLVNIPKFNFYLKLMIDGITSDPFSARTLPPLSKDEQTNNVDKVIEYTRSHYANRRDIVEEEIMRWHLNQGGVAERENRVVNVLEQPEVLNSTTKMDVLEQRFPAVCDGCGQPTTVPFKPDGQRPVYCPDCLKRYRAERSERQRLLQSSPSQLDHLEGASLRQIHRPNISKNNNKGNNGQSSH